MENNNMNDIWEKQKHVPDNEKLDKKMISDYLKPKVSKVSWTFSFNLVFYLAALLASMILLSMNIFGYRENPVMLAVESGLLLLSVVFLGYGIFIFMKIREINNFSKDLHELLESKIKFFSFHYEIWLIITAFVVWILSFALNTLIDNMDGFYHIYRVGFFILISVIMIVFVYAVQKLSAEISLRHLKAFLSDLEASYLAQTRVIEQKKRKMRWIFIVGIILAIGLLILGVLKAISMARF
jgi:hypothetical protein